ncbi:MAG TPA: hypothetical protein DIV79_05235 [Opitutae bacterium]|nr:hypothetical protein [Opitutaceae bacterium]HCR29401.1 hypothetical protein [Opitutae bacterium]
MASIKPLVMRANRLLGATLVEQELVSIDDLDEANDRMAELMSGQSDSHQISLLSILVNEKQSLSEDQLLDILLEEHGLGLIDLANIHFDPELLGKLDFKTCWATLTVPFDLVEDTVYLATSYYLSPAVRSHWEEAYKKNVVWYAATVDSIMRFLEGCESSVPTVAGNN